MGKLSPTSIKYIIRAYIKAKGIVEKPDVIGAVFGQTEGLLGQNLDLRELQATGRIGRIEVNIKNVGGKSEGEILIPSALDASETALIAATIETIERVGPCDATIELHNIEDARATKREYILGRAKDILKNQLGREASDLEDISDPTKPSFSSQDLTTYKGFTCGPEFESSQEVILVEGRADVINLLKNGIANTLAVGGTSIPDEISDVTKDKAVVAFVDGDRGGDLIVKGLSQKTKVDFVVKAPDGKEVEELVKKEIYKALRTRIPIDRFLKSKEAPGSFKPGHARRDRDSEKADRPISRAPKIDEQLRQRFRGILEDIVGTRAALIYDSDNNLLGKVPLAELENTLRVVSSPSTIVVDGKIDTGLVITAKRKGVKYLVGNEKEAIGSRQLIVLDKKDLE